MDARRCVASHHGTSALVPEPPQPAEPRRAHGTRRAFTSSRLGGVRRGDPWFHDALHRARRAPAHRPHPPAESHPRRGHQPHHGRRAPQGAAPVASRTCPGRSPPLHGPAGASPPRRSPRRGAHTHRARSDTGSWAGAEQPDRHAVRALGHARPRPARRVLRPARERGHAHPPEAVAAGSATPGGGSQRDPRHQTRPGRTGGCARAGRIPPGDRDAPFAETLRIRRTRHQSRGQGPGHGGAIPSRSLIPAAADRDRVRRLLAQHRPKAAPGGQTEGRCPARDGVAGRPSCRQGSAGAGRVPGPVGPCRGADARPAHTEEPRR